MNIPRAFLITLVISLIAAPAFAQEPTAAHPGYAGAETCKTCHGAIFDAWQGTKHAHAIDKLAPSERQGDACIRCHVTGSPEQIAAEGAKGSDDKQGWNDCRADASSNPPADDVAFIAALIDRAQAENHVDPMRIYVMGMSNGGFMAFRLGVELPDRIAAIATVGASMAAKSECRAATKKLSVLMINGDADPLVPYRGGDVRFFSQKSRGTAMAVEDAAQSWRVLDGLAAQPAETRDFPKLDAGDKTYARLRTWGGEPSRFQVELIRIEGGGHVEPSIRQRIGGLYRSVVGAQNGDFEAAEEAWRFFKDKRSAP